MIIIRIILPTGAELPEAYHKYMFVVCIVISLY